MAKFSAKANHQRAATGQAHQCGYPYSGDDDADTALDVDGVAVAFCCGGCRGKAAKANDKIATLFADAAFAKAFKVGDAE